ncbi:MAG: phage portal protein [Nitrososphaerota archaeon]|nr:phage portal protein [Nitrososphaerota archaeon]
MSSGVKTFFGTLKANLFPSKEGELEDAPFSTVSICKETPIEKQLKLWETRFAKKTLEEKCYLTTPKLRRCIDVLAGFIVAAGFDTEIACTDKTLTKEELATFQTKYTYVKAYVDHINSLVNLDQISFTAIVQMCINGKAGFEKSSNKEGEIDKLIVLPTANSQKQGLQPVVNTRKRLTGFTLKVKDNPKPLTYNLTEVLYFLNTDLEDDYQGLSDVEALMPNCFELGYLTKERPKAVNRMSNPFKMANVDTTPDFNSTENDVEKVKAEIKKDLESLHDSLSSGDDVVTNYAVTLQMLQLKIDLAQLNGNKNELNREITAYFGVPRFLLSEPEINRATAETEFDAFVNGTVAVKQRYLKRVYESPGWYGALVEQALQTHGDTDAIGKVVVKHMWRKPEMGNLKERADVASTLYNNGLGLLGNHPEQAMKTAGLLTSEIKACLQEPLQPPTLLQVNKTQSSKV